MVRSQYLRRWSTGSLAVVTILLLVAAWLPFGGLGVAHAADTPVVTLESGTNGCNGVLPTPGSANTTKQLDPTAQNDFNPGGHVGYVIDYPVDASDVSGRTTFVITDCVFVNGTAAYKYSISFVPNTTNYQLRYEVPIGTDQPLGGEFCNYAKTTAAPSQSQASNRKAGPSCFTIGGALRIEKRIDSASGDLLTGTNSDDSAHFDVVCRPTTTVPPTIITGLNTPSVTNQDGSVSASGYTTSGTIAVNGPSGTPCDVTETSAPDGYLVDSTVRHLTIPVGTARTVSAFVNHTTGTLTVNKSTDVNGTFHFTVNCGTAYSNTDLSITTDNMTGSWTSDPLPTGTQCTVSEHANSLFTHVSVPADGTVTIAHGDSNHVDFTNTRKVGKLTINKSADVDGTFSFAVTCDSGYSDNAISITTDNGSGSWTSPDLPTGTSCTASEGSNPDYTSTVLGDSTVTIGDNGATVSFSNTHKAAKLTINKSTDEDGTFTFNVDCGAYTATPSITTHNGVGQWSSGELPTGTDCTVTENTPATFTSTSNPADGKVTITTDGAHVDFTNTRKTGTLTIDKTADVDGTFSFKVACDNGYSNDAASITTDKGSGSWTSPDLPTGTRCTVSENNNPLYVSTVGASGDSATITTNGAVVSFDNVHRTGELTIEKAVDKTTAAYGDLLTYTLTVGATGNLTQTHVSVVDPIPTNTTYVECLTNCAGITYSTVDNSLHWAIDSLTGGDSQVATFHVRIVDATPAADGSYAGTTIVNSANVSSDQQPEPVPSNEVTTEVPGYTPPPSSLTVTKVLSPSTDGGRFDLTVNGATEATGVPTEGNTGTGAVTVTAGTVTFGEVAHSGTSLSNYTTSTPTCWVGERSLTVSPVPGQTHQWSVDVPIGAEVGCEITNTRITSPPPPPPPPTPGAAVLHIVKTSVPESGSVVQNDSTIDYTVTVSNSGDAAANGATVVDQLPQYLIDPTAITGNGVYSSTANTITWTVDLAPGATKALTFTATVDPNTPPGTDLVNTATLGNQSSTTTHRTATGNLTIVKSVQTPSGGTGAKLRRHADVLPQRGRHRHTGSDRCHRDRRDPRPHDLRRRLGGVCGHHVRGYV